MSETWSLLSVSGGALGVVIVASLVARAFFWRPTVAVRLRLDRTESGSQLRWEIGNVSAKPITVTKLLIHTVRRGEIDVDGGNSSQTVELGVPHLLAPKETVLIPTEVDWILLSAKAMAVVDADGHEHPVARAQLAAIQDQLRMLIDRRDYNTRPTNRLQSATNIAFGVVVIGAGFAMLMWIAAR